MSVKCLAQAAQYRRDKLAVKADGSGGDPVAFSAISSHYGVAMPVRASQRNVVNIAQRGGTCAVMVSAKALHTAAYGTMRSAAKT